MSHSHHSLDYDPAAVGHKSQTSSTAGTTASDQQENIRPGAPLPTFDEAKQKPKRQAAADRFQDAEDEKRTNLGNSVAVKDAVKAGSLTQDYAGLQAPIGDERKQELERMRRDGFSP